MHRLLLLCRVSSFLYNVHYFVFVCLALPVVTFTDDIFVDKVGANLSIQVNITHDLPAVVPSGIRWFYKNVELIFLNNDKYSVTNDRQTLTVHTLQFTDEGSYTVVVTNIVGSVVSTIQVDVQGEDRVNSCNNEA